MKFHSFAVAALLGTSLIQSQASADGSIAIARSVDDRNFALGVSYSAANRVEADEAAISECLRQQSDTLVAERARCVVVATFDNQCMAFARDTSNGGTAWAYGYDNYQRDAEDRALRECRNQAGNRAGSCEITVRFCDGGGGK